MRKVYHAPQNALGMSVAVSLAGGLTLAIFCIIPFSHLVNKPGRTIEIVKTGTVDIPVAAQEQAPPPPEPEKEAEAVAQPQLVDSLQQVPLSADLEVAMGSGGALAGFGEVRGLTGGQALHEEAFDVSELEKRPEAVTQVAPLYPAELRKSKIEGSVTLVFVLGEDGRVEEPRVENSSRPEFEKPTLEAIRKWRFRPGVKGGQPVRTYIRIPMRFRVASS